MDASSVHSLVARKVTAAATMPTRSALKVDDSAGAVAETSKASNTAPETVSKKAPLTLVVDNSDAKIDFTHYMAMGVWLGWPFFYLCLMWTFPLLWLFAKPLLFTILAMLAVSAFSPIDSRKQPKWAMRIGAEIMKKAPAYFSLRIYCEDMDAVLKTGPALFSMEPHDILPVSIFSFSGILNYFPGHNARGCLSSACFMLPGMRHIYTWGEASDVNKKTIMRNLAKGYSLALCPGGAHEVCYMTDTTNKECVLYLKNRMGLIKMAAINGVAIIPTFTFNQRKAFWFYIPQWRWLHKLGRKIGFIPLYFSGLFGLPYAMPAPTPLTLVVGAPIHVPKMEGVLTEEMLKPYQKQFIDATERIFENNKEQFGMGDIVLKII